MTLASTMLGLDNRALDTLAPQGPASRARAAAEEPSLIRVLDIRSVSGAGGGADKIVLRTAARGAAYGISSTVCVIHSCRDEQFDLPMRGAQSGVDLIAVPQQWPFDPRVRMRLESIVRKGRYDIIHSHDYKANYYGLRLARRFGALAVSTAHGWAPTLYRERFAYYPIDKRTLRRFDAVIGVSTMISQELRKQGVNPERVHTILNGIDACEYAPSVTTRARRRAELLLQTNDVALVSVGRLEREKRFDLLIRAFAEICMQRDGMQLYIVGAGTLQHELERQIHDLGLSSRCRLLGHRGDMKNLYPAFDYYVQSSETEGTPTVLLEAMAVGLPVIATNVGGTSELVTHGVDGLLVPRWDVGALVQGIMAALRDPQASAERASRARRRVETDLSFSRRLSQLGQLYNELANNSRTACKSPNGMPGGDVHQAVRILSSNDSMVARSNNREVGQHPMRALRVCFMIDELGAGGTETHLLRMIKHLDRRRVEPFLCLLNGFSAESQRLEPDCPVLRLGVRSLLRPRSAFAAWRLFRALRSWQIDVLHVHFPDSTYLGVPVARLAGVRAVIRTRRDLFYWVTPIHQRLGKRLDQVYNRYLVDAMVVNSEAVRAKAILDERPSPANIRVVANGLDLTAYTREAPRRRSAAEVHIGVLAMLRPEKRLDVFLQAAHRAAAAMSNVRFTIAGEGPERPRLERLIAELQLSDLVELRGRVVDVPAFLTELDVGVLCSETEGLPNAVIEYMASGLPVIGTTVGGVPELIEDGHTGLLVPPNSPEELSHAMIRLATSQALRQEMGNNGQKRATARFSISAALAEYESLYRGSTRASSGDMGTPRSYGVDSNWPDEASL